MLKYECTVVKSKNQRRVGPLLSILFLLGTFNALLSPNFQILGVSFSLKIQTMEKDLYKQTNKQQQKKQKKKKKTGKNIDKTNYNSN